MQGLSHDVIIYFEQTKLRILFKVFIKLAQTPFFGSARNWFKFSLKKLINPIGLLQNSEPYFPQLLFSNHVLRKTVISKLVLKSNYQKI